MARWRSICIFHVVLSAILTACTSTVQVHDAEANIINLDFVKVEPTNDTWTQFAYDSLHEIKNLDHQLLIYKKAKNDSQLFLGAVLDNQVTEYGFVGEEVYIQDILQSEEQLFGKSVTIVSGLCGANCVENYLFDQINGQPHLIMRLSAPVMVVDLDKDGENELIMMQASAEIQLFIYKQIGDNLMRVNLNEQLGTTNSVTYNSRSKLIEAIIDDEINRYRYNSEIEGLMPSVEPGPSQVPPPATTTPESSKEERTVVAAELIDEKDFVDKQLAWIKIINQDILAINEQDVETFSELRGVDPDPSIMITSPMKSVKFIEAEESTDDAGAVRVDLRLIDSPTEPQYALYSFEKKGDSWIIVDLTVNASYIPRPSEKVSPRLINEADYSGDQLEWVKIINQDVQAIAEGDEEAFDKLRNSKQSLQADIPPVPFTSVELIEIVEQSKNIVRLQVDRRRWGSENEENFINYALVKENGSWIILDVD